MKKLFFLVLFVFVIASVAKQSQAQVTFQKTYGGTFYNLSSSAEIIGTGKIIIE